MARNADRIRALEAKGWTQRQIAQAVGRSPSYVSRVKRGLTPGGLVGEALGRLGAPPGRGARPPELEAPRRRRASGELARVRGVPRRGLDASPQVSGRLSIELPGTGAGIVTEGEVYGHRWHLGGWRSHDGTYTDTTPFGRIAGATGPPSLGAVDQATIYVDGVGYRVWGGPFDETFTLEDAAREAAEFYGVGDASG